MIVSHKHKFIFLRTKKTASTSIETLLSSICGPDDIITPMQEEDEKTRKQLGFRNAQNFNIPLSYYTLNDWKNLILRKKRKKYYHHMPAYELVNYISTKTWNSYFKFCFERNPWDKAISFYYWKNRNNENVSMSEYFQSGALDKILGYDLYTIDNKIVLDKIYKYEEINSALSDLTNRFKLNTPLKFDTINAKSNTRKIKSSYRELLNDIDADIIAKRFKREISLLGYKY